MRDIRDVLKEKELQLQAVKREVEALRVVVPLLAEAPDSFKGLQSDQIIWKDANTGRPVKAWP